MAKDDYHVIAYRKGIEYLQNHSTVQQAKEFLKEIKAMVPFI